MVRLTIALFAAILVSEPSTVCAQDVPPAPRLDPGTSEWMVAAGPALGMELFHSEEGHKYFIQSLSWGRMLSGPHGSGLLRGRFEWALEFIPVFGQFQPDRTYGVGVTPLLWRWNFEPRGKFAHFAELAGGGLWTREPIPERTTTANFTAHLGYGLRYFVRQRLAIVGSYRLHHISNGNRLERNPGINAHVLQLGVSVLR